MGRAVERGAVVRVTVGWELWGGNWFWENVGIEEGNGGSDLTDNKTMEDGSFVSGSYNWYYCLI